MRDEARTDRPGFARLPGARPVPRKPRERGGQVGPATPPPLPRLGARKRTEIPHSRRLETRDVRREEGAAPQKAAPRMRGARDPAKPSDLPEAAPAPLPVPPSMQIDTSFRRWETRSAPGPAACRQASRPGVTQGRGGGMTPRRRAPSKTVGASARLRAGPGSPAETTQTRWLSRFLATRTRGYPAIRAYSFSSGPGFRAGNTQKKH
jgi:hypothetical protein